MHRSQVFLYSLYAFVAGVGIASFLLVSNKLISFFVILGIVVLGVSAYHKTFPATKIGVRNRKLGFLAGALILMAAMGVARLNYFMERESSFEEFVDVKVGGKNIGFDFLGYVDRHPEISNGKQKIIFRVKGVQASDRIIEVDEKILITTNILPEYHFGQYLMIHGALLAPQNFNDFDYITYLKKDGIQATMAYPTIKEREKFSVGRVEEIKITLLENIFVARDAFQEAINVSIPEPNASFVNGILLGIRQNIPEDLSLAFEKTSTTHILAISGYNIAIIANALLIALTYLFRRKTAFWISVGVIIIFTIMVGASASVVRASVMGLLLLFAHGFGRLYDVKNSIIFAGAAMIIINPLVLIFDIGFQLSFLAVVGLVYLYPILDRKIKKIPEWSGVREVALMTLSAQVLVFPLLIYYFESFSVVSLPANIIILPFVPVAMLFGFLTGVFGIFSAWLGWGFGIVAWAVTTFQIKTVTFFANLSFSAVSISIEPITLGAIYLLIFAYIWREQKIEIRDKNSKIDSML
jgi:competence protein ComEC